MSAQRLVLNGGEYASGNISSDMFGYNALFTKDDVIEGGSYDTFLDQMDAGSLRFPGGTVTEELFAPGNPISERFWDVNASATADADEFVTAKEFVAYATARGASVDWVLPTNNFYSDRVDADGNRIPSEEAVQDLLDKVEALVRGDYGDIDLDTVTIGNEFWYKGERETPVEYGQMANVMAKGLQDIFDRYRATLDDPDAWEEPKIAIQTGLAGDIDGVQEIIDQLDDDAREAIDTVETHVYRSNIDDIHNGQMVFDRLDDFQEAEGFGELNYYVSEWNVKNDLNADHGMAHASDLVALMDVMVRAGVDEASVWGTVYKGLYSRLSREFPDQDAVGGYSSELTPAGEVMRMMSESLVGTRAIDIDLPTKFETDLDGENAQDQLIAYAFGNDDKTVIYLASRSADGVDLDLNVDDIVGDYGHMWVQQLSTIDDPATLTDESDPLSYLAKPYLETANGSDVTDADGTIHLSLDGYDLVKLEFTAKGEGVHLWGTDTVVDEDADYTDRLNGSIWNDTIEGHAGDDSLFGLRGNDTLVAGDGDDLLMGGDGNDTIITGEGNDRVFTGTGHDTVFAQAGDNTITINDGGSASIFAETEGDTVIRGFDIEGGDKLSFMGAYEEQADLEKVTFTDGEDLVFVHENGSTTLKGAAAQKDAIFENMNDFHHVEAMQAEIDAVLSGAPVDPADLLVNGSASEVTDYLASLSDEELSDMLDGLDLNAIMQDIPAENLPAFLNALNSDQLDAFFEETDALSLLDQLNEVGTEARAMLKAFDLDVREDYLDHLSDAFPLPDALVPNAETANLLNKYYGTDVVDTGDQTDIPTVDVDEDDNPQADPDDADDGSQGYNGSECFVATAAYGDKFHPDVAYLRKVRDHILVHYMLGRVFIWFYWRVGPKLAQWLAPYPRGRAFARGALALVIGGLRNASVVARMDHGFRSSVYLSGRNPR